MEDGASDPRDDERQGRVDYPESETESEADDEAETVGLYVSVEPFVWTPASAERSPKGGLGVCGLRFTHIAGAAGADSSDSIASITDCVEIWFMGTARCLGLNSLIGPSNSPRRTTADSERGCQ